MEGFIMQNNGTGEEEGEVEGVEVEEEWKSRNTTLLVFLFLNTFAEQRL